VEDGPDQAPRTGDTTDHLQGLLDRLRQGDGEARRDLLTLAHDRLRRLAGAQFYRSFPDLHGRHELDSVLNESWPRLFQALEQAPPPTVEDFFRLAAHKVRQVLLDLARRQRRRDGREAQAADGAAEPSDSTHDPARLAEWTELHERVAELPEPERLVFELRHYFGLKQVEIAAALGWHPRKVSHLWNAAAARLADWLVPD
jgi:RNA polymerase sigma factor (sigma-70 family)